MVWFCKTVLDKGKESIRNWGWLAMGKIEMDCNTNIFSYFFVDSRFRHSPISKENGWVSSHLLLIFLIWFSVFCYCLLVISFWLSLFWFRVQNVFKEKGFKAWEFYVSPRFLWFYFFDFVCLRWRQFNYVEGSSTPIWRKLSFCLTKSKDRPVNSPCNIITLLKQ